ncbi:L-2-hydroxyglutarate oxidase [Cohnella panacarvi]|uniref:L-2-hydroxyglutarate oxidase n=1 Tax=Cohnella panacarvi TaxID=400776 RepID=UPI000478EC02|nr:L-2-hydroxyglutarate oxidase [Cohnella panacarvi]
MRYYDYLIVGSGIIGLTIARELRRRFPDRTIAILEKEEDVAKHSSGRNSGVLHAGFYYSADSLKARFTREGNQAMTRYCEENGLKINKCGKIVVATNEEELQGLYELKKRADRNGVELHWIAESELRRIDSNVRTFKRALYSPTTSTVDPVEVCAKLKEEITANGVEIFFNCPYRSQKDGLVYAGNEIFECGYLINAAGLYADKIAHEAGFGQAYTIIPFKGIYLKYAKNKTDLHTNVYPVPNLKNPFLGVHFTKTVDGTIKIGPTAIPAFWRENYKGLSRFKLGEFLTILKFELKLFYKNAFNFRTLAFEEMKKYMKRHFIGLSLKMVKRIDSDGFGEFMKPGIRAQLLNKETLELLQDFVIEGDHRSMHILNAVSPAFTCSFPFAQYVVDAICDKQGGQKVEAG